MDLKKLQTMNPWYLLLLGVAASILLTEIIDAPLSILFRGYVAWDYLVTGAITAFLVSLTVASILVYLDVIKLKTVKESLLLSENKYHTLIENINEIIYFVDKSGVITYISPSVRMHSGYDQSEMIGRNFAEFIFPDDLPNVFKHFQDTLSGIYEPFEFRVLSKSGEIRWGYSFNWPLLKGEQIVGLQGAVTNITDRKIAEELLRQSEEKYRLLIENIPGVTYIGTPKDRMITFISPNVEKIDGYTPEEYYAMTSDNWWFSRIHPDDIESVGMAYKAALKGEEPLDIEYRIKRKDGRYIWVHNRAIGIYMKEGEQYFYGIFSDITRRKDMEEQIKESLREKEVLLREIHHRVKNNLQTISSLLRLQMRHISDDRYVETFKDIQNRIMVISLVHEKLHRSKDLIYIDINNYIDGLVKAIFQSLGVRADRITINVGHNDVHFDIDRAITCGLIINELVSNAVKHAFPGNKKGEVRIAIQHSSDKEIELIVGDNGVGMPEDMDFRKVESLGLQLVVILAEEQLKGRIELKREDGTEFRIKFRR
jgi:PAS domain S-box-containing protein